MLMLTKQVKRYLCNNYQTQARNNNIFLIGTPLITTKLDYQQ